MKQVRANYFEHIGMEIHHLNSIEQAIERCGIEARLLELVRLRISQINGCSFCVLLHSRRLHLLNESSERIDLISVWREAGCYHATERAAFKWAEAVTALSESSGITDQLYETTRIEFTEEQLSQLTLAIAMINLWNRLAVSFQTDHRHVDELIAILHPTE